MKMLEILLYLTFKVGQWCILGDNCSENLQESETIPVTKQTQWNMGVRVWCFRDRYKAIFQDSCLKLTVT